MLPDTGPGAAPLARVLLGCVALTRHLDAERRQILDIVGPGGLLDLAVLARLGAAAVALTPTQLEPVDLAPEARHALMAANQEMLLLRALGHVARLGRQSAGERVAGALLDLSAQFAEAGATVAGAGFPLHLSRADLADWLGLTLETVSRCMSRLREEGLIAFGREGRLMLTDADGLARIAAGERKVEALYAAKGAKGAKGARSANGAKRAKDMKLARAVSSSPPAAGGAACAP
ncbi:Crp/Fnr family transcriptional regulator [Ancylobacter sp. IITR112]|uniref:Crp/Fnr family transcriptional regulator n=1 Tax=Ancylobacter sp. IITR112 TaxID=3138073 RepID=UPI00352AB5D1